MFGRLWQTVNYYRHRSELWALRSGRDWPKQLRAAPVMYVTMFWFALAGVPFVLIMQLSINVGVSEGVVVAVMGLPALAWLLALSPWFFGLYSIGLEMRWGNFRPAEAREKKLQEWIEAYRVKRQQALP
ncbi:hypothetical protein [Agrobacterium sp.]|jgi:hypothetical protein|uniref:hypothetical protein n=1 Tax=Agrobacterium sp. TaxID=361 RepID=UPI0028A8CADF|nr:hypothetical protein [Agrobacterium sp.]